MKIALKEVIDIGIKRLGEELLVDQILPQDAAAHYTQLFANTLGKFLVLICGQVPFL